MTITTSLEIVAALGQLCFMDFDADEIAHAVAAEAATEAVEVEAETSEVAPARERATSARTEVTMNGAIEMEAVHGTFGDDGDAENEAEGGDAAAAADEQGPSSRRRPANGHQHHHHHIREHSQEDDKNAPPRRVLWFQGHIVDIRTGRQLGIVGRPSLLPPSTHPCCLSEWAGPPSFYDITIRDRASSAECVIRNVQQVNTGDACRLSTDWNDWVVRPKGVQRFGGGVEAGYGMSFATQVMQVDEEAVGAMRKYFVGLEPSRNAIVCTGSMSVWRLK
ncbi:hypothetical protein HK101_011503 [Irineochytrium annulatum]|nr:hypothetical protein HK101_011503 [Irineochytrium annulatum]